MSDIETFEHRSYRKMTFPQSILINHSLSRTVHYIEIIFRWIDTLIDMAACDSVDIFPFQIDFCLSYKNVLSVQKLSDDTDGYSDDDHRAHSNDSIFEMQEQIVAADTIKQRLKENNLRYASGSIYDYPTGHSVRSIMQMYWQYLKQVDASSIHASRLIGWIDMCEERERIHIMTFPTHIFTPHPMICQQYQYQMDMCLRRGTMMQ